MDRKSREIVLEIYKSLEALGAKADLLGTVGSWGDSLPDDDVLVGLREWNAATAKERTEHHEKPFHRQADSRREGRRKSAAR